MRKEEEKGMKGKWGHLLLKFIAGLALILVGIAWNAPSAKAGTPGTWEATGSMASVRQDHTSTLLPNGKVLITGGTNNSGVIVSSAELYDPESGTFSLTGSMGNSRTRHTATLLTNGKVLITGGWSSSGVVGSAELYDPASGTFSSTGSMAVSRSNHTATLLPSGKVLITGGTNSSGVVSSAELYDPALGTFVSTGSMGNSRYLHTASLLPDGKVLITGGYSGGFGILASVEIYDPASGAFSSIGSMGSRRYSHTATLLPDGKVVLIAGGRGLSGTLVSAELFHIDTMVFIPVTGGMGTGRQDHTATLLPNGKVLIAGGLNAYGLFTSVELFDHASGTFIPTGSIGNSRYNHTATLLPDGKVLIAGGSGGGVLASAEVYCPEGEGGTFSPTGSMTTDRVGFSATLLPNGKVLIAGGAQPCGEFNCPLDTAELYDPATGFFTLTGSMGTARFDHTATLLPNGNVLIAGGISWSSYTTSAELYNPATATFIPTGAMVLGRTGHTATLLKAPLLPLPMLGSNVLIAGGRDGNTWADSGEIYNSFTGKFTLTTGALAAVGRADHSATLLPNGKVLITGGYNTTFDGTKYWLNSAELYDPTTKTFSFTGSLISGNRSRHTATLLPDGKVLIAGGYFSIGNTIYWHNAAELYNPIAGTFESIAEPMLVPRHGHTATLLPNGKVLIAGGEVPIDCLFNEIFGCGQYDAAMTELYDWASQTFTGTSIMMMPRAGHTVTLLQNGKVLLAGGPPVPAAELFQTTCCAPMPDLIVMSITTNPVSPLPGEIVTVTVTVKNQGTAPASDFSVVIYKDSATAPLANQTGDAYCGYAGLSENSTVTCTKTVSYASVGNYKMWAQVDSGQDVSESDELNNIFGPKAMDIGDTVSPTGSIIINGNNVWTKSTAVTLTLSCSDGANGSGCKEMQLSNDGVFDTEPWESYTTSKSWTLKTGDGSRAVYVRYRDYAGNISVRYVDWIKLDTTRPVISSVSDTPDPFTPSSGQSTTIGFTISDNLSLTCNVTVNIIHSLTKIKVRSITKNNASCPSTGASDSVIWDGKNGSGTIVPAGTYTYKVQARDKALNWSDIKQGTVTVK